MDLTKENKQMIDNLDYEELLRQWRFTPTGDPMFCGETGDYWRDRMNELRDTVDHVAISKKVGWKK